MPLHYLRFALLALASGCFISSQIFNQVVIAQEVYSESIDNIGVDLSLEDAIEAENFWTDERVNQAKPVGDFNLDSGDNKFANTPYLVADILSKKADFISMKSLKKPFTLTETLIASTEKYPYTYESGYVSNDRYTEYPERTVGKIFFQIGNDPTSLGQCSGAAVASPNGNLIWTAGHCLSDGKSNFYKKVIFIPAYQPTNLKNSRPFGTWAACGLYVTKAWHNQDSLFRSISAGWGNDLGAIKTCRKDKSIHDVIGYLGFLTNVSREQAWNIFAYPGDPPFDGTRMTYCTGLYRNRPDESYGYGAVDERYTPSMTGVGCNMTGGASGGPWILNYEPYVGNQPEVVPSVYGGQATNMINGVNSKKRAGEIESIYSPYFGDAADSLRNFAIQRGS